MTSLKIKAALHNESDDSDDEYFSESEANKKLSYTIIRPTRSKSVCTETRSNKRNDYTRTLIDKLQKKNIPEEISTSIPAINLHNVGNYKQILKNVHKYANKKFYTKLTGNSIKIMLTDQIDFENLTTYYEENNESFHTCTCPNDDNLFVAVKGVPHSLSVEELFNTLLKKYPVVRMNRVFNKFNRKSSSTCFVEVEDSAPGRNILNMEYLLHTKVVVELWIKDKAMPCKNCKKYSRERLITKIESIVCTKCKGSHHYSICPMRKLNLNKQSKQCLFCERYHADYKSCPYYEKLLPKNDDKTIDFHTDKVPNNEVTLLESVPINEETNLEEKVSKIIGGPINCNRNVQQPPVSTESLTVLLLFVVVLLLVGLCYK